MLPANLRRQVDAIHALDLDTKTMLIARDLAWRARCGRLGARVEVLECESLRAYAAAYLPATGPKPKESN